MLSSSRDTSIQTDVSFFILFANLRLILLRRVDIVRDIHNTRCKMHIARVLMNIRCVCIDEYSKRLPNAYTEIFPLNVESRAKITEQLINRSFLKA